MYFYLLLLPPRPSSLKTELINFSFNVNSLQIDNLVLKNLFSDTISLEVKMS